LQKFLGREVSEIVAWDYPTIAQLSRHLTADSEVLAATNMVAEEELAAESRS